MTCMTDSRGTEVLEYIQGRDFFFVGEVEGGKGDVLRAEKAGMGEVLLLAGQKISPWRIVPSRVGIGMSRPKLVGEVKGPRWEGLRWPGERRLVPGAKPA